MRLRCVPDRLRALNLGLAPRDLLAHHLGFQAGTHLQVLDSVLQVCQLALCLGDRTDRFLALGLNLAFGGLLVRDLRLQTRG